MVQKRSKEQIAIWVLFGIVSGVWFPVVIWVYAHFKFREAKQYFADGMIAERTEARNFGIAMVLVGVYWFVILIIYQMALFLMSPILFIFSLI